MNRNVVVTGLGFVTCLGHSNKEVGENLRGMKHGVVRHQAFIEDAKVPISVAAPIPGFKTDSNDPEDWTYPNDIRFRLEQLRALSPNGLYSHFATKRAFEDANLSEEEISNPRTGLFTASSGSVALIHHNLERMKKVGPLRCSPLGIVASIAGTLNFNLVAHHKIKGASTGFVSACASSGHALGYAFDEITLGRQDRMIVVGAEDFTFETIVPFSGMRVLSVNENPDEASRPFDKKRDGFVGTGGAVTLILEEEEVARKRGAKIYARYRSWGQGTDGHHVAISHPEGEGLKRAMENALRAGSLVPNQIDYINAHATSTPMGDVSECLAIKSVFGEGSGPAISSTKALTGHALSLSSAMEAAFTVLSIHEGFKPGSAHITELDPAAEGLNIIQKTDSEGAKIALSNSSGFGGANVSLAFEKVVD